MILAEARKVDGIATVEVGGFNALESTSCDVIVKT